MSGVGQSISLMARKLVNYRCLAAGMGRKRTLPKLEAVTEETSGKGAAPVGYLSVRPSEAEDPRIALRPSALAAALGRKLTLTPG